MAPAEVSEELATLNREILACTRCELHRTATRGVPGEGPANADVMFVGEGPGFNEDKQGRPFVGAAGKLLDEKLLPLAGLRREDVYITNIVKHRPPNNRDPLPNEVAECKPWLEQQIELVSPGLIVTLGRFSLGTFFPGDLISRVHGQIREKDARFFFNMYHPAAALHQESLAQTLQADMRRLGEFLRSDRWTQALARGRVEPDEEPEQLSLF